MKKIRLFIFMFSILSFISCKKDKSIHESSNCPNAESYTPAYMNGRLDIIKSEIIRNDSLINLSCIAFGSFSDSLIDANTINFGYYDVGNVTLNNIILKKIGNNLDYWYTDTSNLYFNPSFKWQISGNANINGFNYTNYYSYPSYSNYQNLPDSINTNNDLTIDLTNLNNLDRVEVYAQNVDDPSLYTNIHVIEKPITSITFQSFELNQAYREIPGEKLILHFRLYKNNFQRIGNKIYNFRTGYFLSKINVIPYKI